MREKVAIALIGIIPACLTAVIGFVSGFNSTDLHKAEKELERKRISLVQSPNPNFKQLTYPNYGISLDVPVSWTVEDGPAMLSGGEFNLIQRYEETKGAIGINFRLRPVQPNYINDLNSQILNMKETLLASYNKVKVEDVALSGLNGKLFIYDVPTGKRTMIVKTYWIRVVPTVQLQILCAQYKDAKDYDEFWRNCDQIISSIVIAFDTWQERYKRNG